MAEPKFRSPIRKKVRQRSGFKTVKSSTGGEVKLKLSKKLTFTDSIELSFEERVNPVNLFKKNIFIIAGVLD